MRVSRNGPVIFIYIYDYITIYIFILINFHKYFIYLFEFFSYVFLKYEIYKIVAFIRRFIFLGLWNYPLYLLRHPAILWPLIQ